ncbi:PREDICTED: zinc finger protein 774, partial [Mesitornis unicolor]|uniref:zinc finger protein 774 n=1 Tax=Mesitornis unicolor TaxID=54374 RepID=UPI0005284678
PDENTKRDPAADGFDGTGCDSEAAGEKLCKDPSPGVMWDSHWHSEVMETSGPGSGLGGDTRYDRGFGERLDFFSGQENGVGKTGCALNKCERNPSQQEQPNPVGGREGEVFLGERSLGERAFRPQHLGEKDVGQQGAAPAQGGQNLADSSGFRHRDGLGGEERPGESEENSSPCWDHPQEKSEACGRCRQHFGPRGGPASQQQGQGRGKSYICSDCGKSFVCHSWLVRHQTTHTGERPYKCSECDKSYRRKDYLLNHQRRHSGEGLFQCPLCQKRFVLRRSFVKHQESHVQETHLTLGGWPCAEIRGSVM